MCYGHLLPVIIHLHSNRQPSFQYLALQVSQSLPQSGFETQKPVLHHLLEAKDQNTKPDAPHTQKYKQKRRVTGVKLGNGSRCHYNIVCLFSCIFFFSFHDTIYSCSRGKFPEQGCAPKFTPHSLLAMCFFFFSASGLALHALGDINHRPM